MDMFPSGLRLHHLEGTLPPRLYLEERVYKVVLQKSILTQIRQLILYRY